MRDLSVCDISTRLSVTVQWVFRAAPVLITIGTEKFFVGQHVVSREDGNHDSVICDSSATVFEIFIEWVIHEACHTPYLVHLVVPGITYETFVFDSIF